MRCFYNPEKHHQIRNFTWADSSSVTAFSDALVKTELQKSYGFELSNIIMSGL